MTNVSLVDDLFVLEVPQREVYLAKAVPGSRYHHRSDGHLDHEHFVVPATWASAHQLKGLFNSKLVVDRAASEWVAAENRNRVQPALKYRALELAPEDEKGFPPLFFEVLRPYQRAGVRFLATAGNSILGWGMRVGKTRTAALAACWVEAFPVLVVCPNSVKSVWEEEYAEVAPDVRVAVVRGGAKQRRDAIECAKKGYADVLVINWEALRLHTRLTGYGSSVSLRRCKQHGGNGKVTEAQCEVHPKELNEIAWGAVIADEAHRALHPRSKQTRALWAVSEGAKYRWALSGTPILSSPEDLWALGRFVEPREYPSKVGYIDRYAQTGWNIYSGGLEVIGLREDTKSELFAFLDPRFHRLTRDIVLPHLPKLPIPQRRVVEMEPKQKRAYRELEERMLTELDNDEILYVTNPLTKRARLLQFAGAFATLEDGRVKLTMPSCKVNAMLDVAEELGGEPAIVWSESKQLLKLTGTALTKAGYDIVYHTGDEPEHERTVNKRAFQRGDAQFILATIKSAKEGIDLSRADVAVFLQRSYSFVENEQAESRMVGQAGEQGLEILDIVSADTVEYRVFDIVEEKGERIEEIVRDKETWRRLLGG